MSDWPWQEYIPSEGDIDQTALCRANHQRDKDRRESDVADRLPWSGVDTRGPSVAPRRGSGHMEVVGERLS